MSYDIRTICSRTLCRGNWNLPCRGMHLREGYTFSRYLGVYFADGIKKKTLALKNVFKKTIKKKIEEENRQCIHATAALILITFQYCIQENWESWETYDQNICKNSSCSYPCNKPSDCCRSQLLRKSYD